MTYIRLDLRILCKIQLNLILSKFFGTSLINTTFNSFHCWYCSAYSHVSVKWWQHFDKSSKAGKHSADKLLAEFHTKSWLLALVSHIIRTNYYLI